MTPRISARRQGADARDAGSVVGGDRRRSTLGNGERRQPFNMQNVTTTISAQDGETVAIGGLISRRDRRTRTRFPGSATCPISGRCSATARKPRAKTELLVILTPHVVRTRAEADRVLAEESRRMDYMLGDVVRTQGLSGMAPVLHPNAFAPLPGKGDVDGSLAAPVIQPIMPPDTLLGTPPPPFTPAEPLPPPRVTPPAGPQGPVLPVPPAPIDRPCAGGNSSSSLRGNNTKASGGRRAP